MNYNEIADIYTVSEVDDGLGGFEQTMNLEATIRCKVAPYTVKVVDNAGIPMTYSNNKLFTQNKKFLDDIYSPFYIVYKGVTYKKINVMDAGKCLIIEMERIQ